MPITFSGCSLDWCTASCMSIFSIQYYLLASLLKCKVVAEGWRRADLVGKKHFFFSVMTFLRNTFFTKKKKKTLNNTFIYLQAFLFGPESQVLLKDLWHTHVKFMVLFSLYLLVLFGVYFQ